MNLKIVTNRLLGLIIPVILLAAWYLVTKREIFSPQLLPPPGMIFDTWREMQGSGELATNMTWSLFRVGAGFLAGATGGLLLGTAMGLWRPVEGYLFPLFNLLRQVPTVAWLPFLVLWLGIDELFKVVFIALGALIPMTLKTFEGIRGVPASYVEVVRVFEYGWFGLLRTVVFPAALPSILTGLRLSLAESWMLVVGAELVAASAGIGNVMTVARRLFQTDVVLVGVIAIAVTGYAMDRILLLLEGRLLSWRRSYNPQ